MRAFSAEVDVRGTKLNVEKTVRHCDQCSTEFESSRDHDWRLEAYAAFRRTHGYVFPEELKNWRLLNDLTQAEVAALLGFGENTLGRYEAGALQTDANDVALKRIMTSQGMIDAVMARPDVLSAEKRSAIMRIHASASAQAAAQTLLMASIEQDDVIYTGCRRPSFGRIAAFVSHLSCKQVNKTVLNKLMFYSDFLSYRESGRSISGLAYARLPYGPVPHNYESIFGVLSAIKVIEITPVKLGKCVADSVRAIQPSIVMADLKGSEPYIRYVKARFDGFTSKQISEFSHKELAWLDIEPRQLIPYRYAEHIDLTTSRKR